MNCDRCGGPDTTRKSSSEIRSIAVRVWLPLPRLHQRPTRAGRYRADGEAVQARREKVSRWSRLAVLACPLAWLVGFACRPAGSGRTSSRAHRRGGYIRPSASTPTKSDSEATREWLHGGFDGMTPTMRLVVEGCSSSTRPGGASAGWAIPRALRDPSRLTGRGWSTLGTATRGASGAPPDSAA